MSITKELSQKLEPNTPFTLKDAYQTVTSTDKQHSIRARIYEGIDKGLFRRVSQGVYTMVDHKDNSVLLVQGDGRDLSMISDQSIDCIITDHPYNDQKSNKGGNRNFATYNVFNYTQEDFNEKARVLKEGAFLVEFFAEENANNYEYIYNCKRLAKEAGLDYYATVPWKKGSFVANTGRKAKNTEQMVFFTKGSARALKLDTKKNKAQLTQLGLDVKSLSSEDAAILSQQHNLPIHRMKGTSKMLPTVFDIENTSKTARIHQAEKPVELFKQLLEYITLPNELVLDQYTGSANIGIACLETGRNALLLEKDPEIYQKAQTNLTSHYKTA